MDYKLKGSPSLGLGMATLGLFAGLTTIVFYGVAGPVFKETLGLTGLMLGLLLSSPHLSKALLRVPFGAWVDRVGGRLPFLTLLGLSVIGTAGLVGVLVLYHPHNMTAELFPHLLGLGLLGGAGAATFSVGVPQTSYWFGAEKQGYALGVYAGVGNVGPGLFNLVMPLLVVMWGLAGAYGFWLVFLVVVTLIYYRYGIDAYYFQLRKQGLEPEDAMRISQELGQEYFPSGTTTESLTLSARNPRTWLLVFLYSISFGGGFTALTAWFPTYWYMFHDFSLFWSGLLAAMFTAYGSLIRVAGGKASDKYGGERTAALSFLVMAVGAFLLAITVSVGVNLVGMMVLATGMGVANAAVFELVPKYVPDAVGGASGWIGGVGGAGTLVMLPLLGAVVDRQGPGGYASGFWLYVVLSLICAGVAYLIKTPSGSEQSCDGYVELGG